MAVSTSKTELIKEIKAGITIKRADELITQLG
jgi:hypothetical protein